MSPVAIGGLLLAGVLAIVTPIMVAAYLRQRIPWKQVAGRSFKWHSIEGSTATEEQVRNAVDAAFRALTLHNCFQNQTLLEAGHALHVLVQRVNDWESPTHGGRIAGKTEGHTIYVGDDLASVCHELAHLCELIETKRYDFDHRTWGMRRIWLAIDDASRQ